MEYNINSEADSIIRTLQSIQKLEGKIDYDANKGTFQKVEFGYFNSLGAHLFGWSEITGDHLPIQKGLEKLKDRIITLNDEALSANPEELNKLKEKIDKMQNLFLSVNKILLDKVLPFYDQDVAICFQINELAKVFMKSVDPVNKKIALAEPSPLTHLPNDVWRVIFSKLKISKSIYPSSLVDKNWNELTADFLWTKDNIFEKFCVNPVYWKQIFDRENSKHLERYITISDDQIAKAYASLPDNIIEILKSSCPIFPDKKIIETHDLIWMPETDGEYPVFENGKSTKKLRDLLQHPNRYSFVIAENINKPHWLLVLKSDFTQNKSYEITNNLINNLNQNFHVNYRIPEAVELLASLIGTNFLKPLDHKNILVEGDQIFSYDGTQLYTKYQQLKNKDYSDEKIEQQIESMREHLHPGQYWQSYEDEQSNDKYLSDYSWRLKEQRDKDMKELFRIEKIIKRVDVILVRDLSN